MKSKSKTKKDLDDKFTRQIHFVGEQIERKIVQHAWILKYYLHNEM